MASVVYRGRRRGDRGWECRASEPCSLRGGDMYVVNGMGDAENADTSRKHGACHVFCSTQLFAKRKHK